MLLLLKIKSRCPIKRTSKLSLDSHCRSLEGPPILKKKEKNDDVGSLMKFSKFAVEKKPLPCVEDHPNKMCGVSPPGILRLPGVNLPTYTPPSALPLCPHVASFAHDRVANDYTGLSSRPLSVLFQISFGMCTVPSHLLFYFLFFFYFFFY